MSYTRTPGHHTFFTNNFIYKHNNIKIKNTIVELLKKI